MVTKHFLAVFFRKKKGEKIKGKTKQTNIEVQVQRYCPAQFPGWVSVFGLLLPAGQYISPQPWLQTVDNIALQLLFPTPELQAFSDERDSFKEGKINRKWKTKRER